MDEAGLENKLNELMEQFGGTKDPDCGRLAIMAKQAQASSNQLQQSVSKLQESLDYLRICIKYLLLDLEATRRENEYLRKLLKEQEE